MSFLESLIYGLISGLSEFFPISSPAHQQLIKQLFGAQTQTPVQDLFVHIGLLVAVMFSCKTYLELGRRERYIQRRRSRHTRQPHQYDRNLVRQAAFPMLIGILALRFILNLHDTLLLSAIFLLLNGIILFIPERMIQGNKNARHMSSFDSLLIGASGALSAFCGISRIGSTYSVSVARGAAKKHALNWSILLSLFALSMLAFIDVVAIFTTHTAIWPNLLSGIFSGVTAYLGGVISISIMRFIINRPATTEFSYYCWGVGLLSFVLYLTIG